MKLYQTLFNHVNFELPHQAILDCSHSGSCDSDVEHWQRELNLNLDREDMIRELEEYGAWELDELHTEDNGTLEGRLIWIAAGTIRDELKQ